MLLCDNTSFYVGISSNVFIRVREHRNKLSIATKEFHEIKVVYCEKYVNKYEAAKREKQLKGWSKAKKQMLVNGILRINRCTAHVEVLVG